MSRPIFSILVIGALALGSGLALAQQPDFGLRRLTPPPVAQPPRRTPPPRPAPPQPAPAPAAQPVPASRAAAAQPATPAAPIPYARSLSPGPAPTPPSPGLAGGRPVIIIDSRRIGDPAGTLIEVSRASRQVVQEFGPRTEELLKLKTEAERTQAAADAARGRDKESLTAQARLQKAEFDTRNAALEKEFKERSDTLLAPIQTRINESLKAFANAQGAVIVLDGARFNGAVLAMKAGTDPAALDLTAAFIESYNRAHP